MSNSNSNSNGGVGFFGLMGLLFIGLKLGHVINWSWWLVTLPLWGGIALVIAFGLVAALLAAVFGRRASKAAARRAAQRRASLRF